MNVSGCSQVHVSSLLVELALERVDSAEVFCDNEVKWNILIYVVLRAPRLLRKHEGRSRRPPRSVQLT